MRIFLILLLAGTIGRTAAQSANGPLPLKNVNDTVLRNPRQLLLPAKFDAWQALRALFPGEHSRLNSDGYTNEMINWTCKTCKRITYPDVNENPAGPFPFAGGVATRVLNVLDYKDAKGTSFKLLTFNHSIYDEEGMQTSRFTGGLLGLAKFNQTASGWKLTFFEPAIAAYGAFAAAPAPGLLRIGEDQYALLLKHSNGGGGGPFEGSYYLVAGAAGHYRQVMHAEGTARTGGEEGLNTWEATCSVPESGKKFYRDILVTLNGTFSSGAEDDLPPEVRQKAAAAGSGKFRIVRRYSYTAAKGYQLQPEVQVTVSRN